jgi:catechol 2,3-dioxygenase-like lactoylglutathione lyase family enzyme
MKLNHVALSISNVDDVIDFYQNILGFNLEYQFELPATLSKNIFGIDQSSPAYFCKKEQVVFELFVLTKKMNNEFAHICLEIPDREQLVSKCRNKGYKVNIIQREGKPYLLFVCDRAGNAFEIKEGKNID